jgi:hypothetical protein
MRNIPRNSNFGFTKWCVALIAAFMTFATTGWGQVNLTNTNFIENFDSMGTSTTASLPSGWKYSAQSNGTTANYWSNSANLSTNTQGASSGSPATGGRYNWGWSNVGSTNRAPGFLTSSGYKIPNSLMVAFSNNTGATITNLSVSFAYYRFRTASSATTNFFYFTTNPASWGTALATNTWASITSTNYFWDSNVAATNKQIVSLASNPVSITNGGVFYMNWIFDQAGTGSNGQGLGVDDVLLTAQTAVAATAPQAPTITQVTPGNGLLSVDFTAPSSNGGAAVTNYQYSTDGINYVSRSPNSTTSPLIISGLSNGMSYSVTLKAVNSVGAGTASTAVLGTPVQPLTVPTVTPATITGKVGVDLSTNIQASSSPTSYAIATGTLPTGLSLNSSSGAIIGSPSNAVTGHIVSVTASNVAGNSAPQNLTFNISKGDQTISGLSAASTQYTTNAPYELSATASSRLDVSYASSDTNVATIAGSTVTIVGAGTTTITASQAGNSNWNPATDVTQTLTVTAPPVSLTVAPSQMGGFNAALGSSSDVKNLNVVGLNLVNDVVISPVAGFEFSTDGITYVTNGLTLPKGNGGLTNDISVRMASDASGGLFGGSISVATITNGTSSLIRSTTVRGAVGVYWDFATASPATNAVPQDWTLGPVTQGNNNGGPVTLITTASVSSGYTGVSGTSNAGVAAQTGGFNPTNSAYFEIPIVVPETDTNTLTDYGVRQVVFGSRSTGTGPVNYTIRSSADNYQSDLAMGSVQNDSNWSVRSNANVNLLLSKGTNTIRIYGYGSSSASQSGGSANWRIDDLVVTLGSIVNTNPTLSLLPSSIAGLKGFTGSPSPSSSYVVKGTNLLANLNLQVSTNAIQISTDNTTFTNQLTLTPTTNGVLSNAVYVRLSSEAALGPVTGTVQHVSGSLTNTLSVAGTVYDAARGGSATTLAGWDVNDQVGGAGNFGTSPLAPTIKNSDVIVGGMTRGSGVQTSSTGAGRAWGGTTWEDANSVDAIANGKFVAFTLQATSGKTLSLTSLPKFNYRAATSFGPTNGLIQYQVGSGAFKDVTQVTYTNNSNGQTLSPVNLSGIQDLQNVPASQQITFRIVNWGGQTNPNPAFPGSWYIFDTANTPDIDFEVTGIVNSNSAPTNITLSPATIAENNAVSAQVGAFSTTDSDVGNTFVYTLVAGTGDTDNASFNIINGNLVATTVFDYETRNSYWVRVRSTDQGGLYFEKQLTILGTDVNESPIVTSDGVASVAESQTAVQTVTGTDPDAGTTLSYRISGGADSALFTINSSTGVLTFVSAPDYEIPTDAGTNNVYDVTVEVSDGTLTATKAVAVTVTNVNEAPSITSSGAVNAAENQTAAQTVVGSDSDASSTLTYSITGGADSVKFTINSSTGVLTFVSAPDFENPTDVGTNNVYDVIVEVSDGMLTATKAVTVTVTNIIDSPADYKADWLATNGLAAGSDWNSDPNSVGYSLATAYAFGLDPKVRSGSPITLVSSPTGSVKIVYLQKDNGGVTYAVKTGTDLAAGLNGNVIPTVSASQPSPAITGYTRYEATYTPSAPATKGFAKVQANVP